MAALDWTSSSSISFSTGFFSYDVFLNFRGEDTRNNFTGFLNQSLKHRGIDVFIDSEKLWTGEAIGPTCLIAIQGSKISIPVFSTGYARSKWCLLELEQIVQCHISNGHMILPIFFYVEPSQVRNQTGSFEEAFQEHEKNFEPNTVRSWRESLRVVGNLKGEVIDKNKDQAEIVELVVRRVLHELVSSTHLAECKYPRGINSRVEDLLSLLNISSNDVLFIGICGCGGIGKTTIAKAVFNHILLSFNKHSFISDVREQATQCMGLTSLQKRLLKDIFKTEFDIGDYHRGKRVIEQRFRKENVLLVLDDVDSREQIDALAAEPIWFGEGSRIIITTRAENILNAAKVDKDKIYWPQELDHQESLQLFSLHAFSMDQPPEDYMQLSHDVVYYSKGLPSTLEELGSYLSGISSKEVWKITLQRLNAGVTSISSLASSQMQRENTCHMEDSPSGWRLLLHGSHGNNTDTVVRESKPTEGYLNRTGSTTTVRGGNKRFAIAKIRAALSKFSRGYQNLNGSTTTDRVCKRFRMVEIRAATKNFDESLLVGVGSFGLVYKGVLDDGTLAAIKRPHPQSEQCITQFEIEIEILSNLRHKHVTSLIGFCGEKNEMILVYEYLAKGNLRNHLYGTDFPSLTWKQRLEICIGVARGLHYLHTGSEKVIIHRDVKTTNILLDKNFTAKMADFGLSKTGSELDHTHVSTMVKGTVGYIDPEYYLLNQVTVKTDVFSFGVVLFEVVCARPALDKSLPNDQVNLARWALQWQRQGSFETIVDRRLEGNYCRESLKKFGEIAGKCVSIEGKNRPMMGEVLSDLELVLQLQEAWLSSNVGEESTISSLASAVGSDEFSQLFNP